MGHYNSNLPPTHRRGTFFDNARLRECGTAREAKTAPRLSAPRFGESMARSDVPPALFTQQDQDSGDKTAPPSLHRYIYTINSPVNYSDPEGRNPVVQFSGMIFTGLFIASMIMAMVLDKLGVNWTDLIGHFESGFAFTFGGDLLGFLLLQAFAPGAAANVTAAIAGMTLISVLIGTLLEATVFNTGGFSGSDWFWQTLGATLASVLVLMMLKDQSFVAELEGETLFPIAAMIFVTLIQGFYYAGRVNLYGIINKFGLGPPQPQQ